MADVAVKYLGGSPGVYIPAAAATCLRGQIVKVPAAVAGRPPGDWRARIPGDPKSWPARIGADGMTVETQDPGDGLLAQVDLWAPAAKEDRA